MRTVPAGEQLYYQSKIMPMTKKEKEVLEEAQDSIGAIRDKYQDVYDSRSESWQESEKADEMQELIDCLDDICTDIEDVLCP